MDRTRSGKFYDRTGMRYGRLLVLERAEYYVLLCGMKQTQWLCRCDCGNATTVRSCNLTAGGTQLCGCLSRELQIKRQTKHGQITNGHTSSPIYSSFHSAKQRCNNPNASGWKYYGGRGIGFRFESFQEFLADIGPRPSLEYSIDRINNDGHYEKGNVRWATASEQNQNKHCFGCKPQISALKQRIRQLESLLDSLCESQGAA